MYNENNQSSENSELKTKGFSGIGNLKPENPPVSDQGPIRSTPSE